MLHDVGDPDICGWSEQPDKNRDFVAFMRMFYVFKKDKEEDTKYGDIGTCTLRITIQVCLQVMQVCNTSKFYHSGISLVVSHCMKSTDRPTSFNV